MDKHELAKRLMATFLEELHEHVDALNRDLLALEKNPPAKDRAALFKTIFRSAHSLKGASRAVSVELIEQACHKMEDILGAVREGQRPFSPALFSLLFKTADAIAEVGTRLRSEQELSDAPLQKLMPLLVRTVAGEDPTEMLDAESRSDTAVATMLKDAAPEPKKPADSSIPWAGKADVTKRPDEGAANRRAATAATAAASGPATIRVAAEKLDSLLAQSGELLVARRRVALRSLDADSVREAVANLRAEWQELQKPLRNLIGDGEVIAPRGERARAQLPRRAAAILERTGGALKQLEKDCDNLVSRMVADSRLLRQSCDALDDEVRHVRMLPFAEACGGLQRTLRDLAQAAGKRVELAIQGEQVEMDRSVLEGLKDPLLHLVRNAIDHGIELPGQRTAAGKPAVGRVTVSAELRGGRVEVVVSDDGRGFDLDRIREKLRSKGMPVSDDERELARTVFLPGFSTAPIVTDVSGRGVGLDVVQSQIESLHGSVDVTFEPGAGTRFSLTVPLTLTTIRCLLTVTGGQTFAMPTSAVGQIVRFGLDSVRCVGGRDMLLLGGTPIPLAGLADTLGQESARPPAHDRKSLAVVLVSGDGCAALLVDELTTEQEVLVKNLGARIRRARHFSGATLLPSGHVALVLNAANVIRTALGKTPLRTLVDDDQPATQTRKRLLVVEDSMTTRMLVKSILETAGYEVVVAVDGHDAWLRLEQQPFDLVVTDVDMPRMNGFELTTTIRESSRFGWLPVVLVTARGTDEDKARGIQVGANAYLIKSSFDQRNLLETIEQLL